MDSKKNKNYFHLRLRKTQQLFAEVYKGQKIHRLI